MLRGIEALKKVLLLGSGALQIGQAGEFDYSGSQAIKALKEEKITVILINPNIATIQTSDYLADKIYFLPVTPYFVEKVIQKEKPDGILLSFGGQTALNCGVELYKKGILEKYRLKVLGTSIKSVMDCEDRKLFSKRLNKIKLKIPRSIAVNSLEQALKAAKKIGYPVIARIAYALGGLGSSLSFNEEDLRRRVLKAFCFTPQILIEEYLEGWQEIEYEVVRDNQDNCITVCNMENFDPMGIHTGESIVVAPSQTLNDREYHKLRNISIQVIRNLNIIGECNIQFALNKNMGEYRIIEVNPRLSRSSALASKATGYPLAFIAAKLALGYSLIDLPNSITKTTKACFEPALDYVVVKIPRWDLTKFKRASNKIGSEMKSVGEVMAIGRNFEEALQKALRMLQVGVYGLVCNDMHFENVKKELKNPTDKRIFAIAEAIHTVPIKEIQRLTQINPWFLYKIKNIVDLHRKLTGSTFRHLPKELLLHSKMLGFSDKQIALIFGKEELDVRELRKKFSLYPSVKQIDTLAAEYPARTNYLYLTYNSKEDDIEFRDKNNVIVLGSGSYRIGSSVEFDWCCVNTVISLRSLGYKTIMINYNPETVSTDYDICHRLYFDELSFETVADIYEKENPKGIIISMGGQIPNNIATKCAHYGINVLGTSPENIDNAENRHKFSSLLDKLGIDQPAWKELTNIDEAKSFAQSVGYPVLIRPSYVLSGAAMSVALNASELVSYLRRASEVSPEYPVIISKFIENAKEIELDGVAKKGELFVYAICEHVENAGVHSGDATMVLPPQRTYLETTRRMKKITRKIVRALEINGPFNIQFIAKDNMVKVIECNLRASRSFPFVSKIFKLNFVELATKLIMGLDLPTIDKSCFELDYVGVKAPQFSFTRIKGADPVLSVEMASTGEVACIGDNFEEAFLKALLSVGYDYPKRNILLSTGPFESKARFLPEAKKLMDLGFNLYATRGTADYLQYNGIESKVLYWPLQKKEPNILSFIEQRKLDLIINIPKSIEEKELTNDYIIRRKSVDFNIPIITNLEFAERFIDAISKIELNDLAVKPWDEY
ncbi:MAG: carbamoyl-phosphate synthase (glutamine-hydrolyzing) large subunit [Candidatus Aminicenantes bacterium]|nr:carbamoyl-phosphate synthase (glutamine-hydrolyzing) large subunit [Candidatus Aminicenantes bacterium]HHF51164.1 carbamoyl-phosphate synthase (glutamine-hydrolyzing) large subunit [Candidatus Aminicenantes bacterium]